MNKILMTTALVIPMTAGLGWAQTATTGATPPAVVVTDPAMPAGTMPADATTMPADTTTMPAGTMPAGTMPADTTTMPAGTMPAGTMPADTTTLPAGTTVVPVDTNAAAAATPADVVRQQAANELRVDWITGTNVTSTDGETVGDVTDVIIDGDSGMMKAVIVGVGGFLGIGEKQIAIDWAKLQVDYDANRITTAITRDEARAAPEYQFREQAAVPAGATATMNGTATAPMTGTVATDPMAPAATNGMATTGAAPTPATTAPAN